MKICSQCLNPIPDDRRSDANFCHDRCRKKNYRGKTMEERVIRILSPALATLCEILRANSLDHMVGYILGLLDESGSTTWMPSLTGSSKRHDGTFDDHPYFELRPKFEIPRVPAIGIYQVEFVCLDHMRLAAPANLAGGIYVPVEFRMCLPGQKNIARPQGPRKY